MLLPAKLLSVSFCLLVLLDEAKGCYLVNNFLNGCSELLLTGQDISKCTEIRMGGVSLQQKSVNIEERHDETTKGCYLVNNFRNGCNKLLLTEPDISNCTEIRMGGVSLYQNSVTAEETHDETILHETTTDVRTGEDKTTLESTQSARGDTTSAKSETTFQSASTTHDDTTSVESETTFGPTSTAGGDTTSVKTETTFRSASTTHDGTTSVESETTFGPTSTAHDYTTSVESETTFGPTSTEFSRKMSTGVLCPPNMIYTRCTCPRTCQDPNRCVWKCYNTQNCRCPTEFFMNGNDCVSKEHCGCYVDDHVLPNGTVHVSHNCTKNCSCIDGQLICKNFQCSDFAECMVHNGNGRCVCNNGFSGNGETCVRLTDCYDAFHAGFREDGVYTIYPTDWPVEPFDVYCNMSEEGWTVVQRNGVGDVNFYRNWSDYKEGFGDFQNGYWLGNEKLHYLTRQRTYRLRVGINTATGVSLYAEYTDFQIGPESDKYRITSLGTYAGNAGDGLSSSFMYPFSTYDMDDDGLSSGNCAEGHRGGWWYGGSYYSSSSLLISRCNTWLQENVYYSCSATNLNGDTASTNGEAAFWGQSQAENCNLQYTEMKLFPVFF